MTAHLWRAPGAHASVSGSDRRTLDALFAHPIAHNLAWMDVIGLMRRIGDVEERSDQVFVFRIEADKIDVHKPHTKHLTAPEVIDLRRFLEHAGWVPEAHAAVPESPGDPAPSLIVVIDHHEARVWHVDLGSQDEERHAVRPYDAQHFLHNTAHKARIPDHVTTPEGDRDYYESIAQAVAKGGRIVVVGHGAGEGNAANALASFLRDHHPLTYARMVKPVVADLPALTQPELLRIAREALMPDHRDSA